jgi:hypothetical protein
MKKYLPYLGVAILLYYFLFGGCTTQRTEFGCECEGNQEIQKTKVLTASDNVLEFSVYSETGRWEADAGCHATMYFTYSWSDSTMAVSDIVPPVTGEYLSPLGYFLETDAGTGSGIIPWTEHHPGAKIYYRSCNEAIDKNNPEGASYGIRIVYNSNEYPGESIIVKANISYKVYNETYHKDGCVLETHKSGCNF